MARKKKNEKTQVRPALIPVIIFLLYFLITFRTEIRVVFGYWWWILTAIPKVILKIDIGILSLPENFAEIQRIIWFNIFNGFAGVFILWLFLAALQTLLPAASLWDVVRTMLLVFRHFMGKNIRIARVVGGQNISPPEKLERKKKKSLLMQWMLDDEDYKVRYEKGIIVQDSNSAVVLEEMSAAPDLLAILFRKVLSYLWLIDDVTPRICGPGLVFLHPWERVHSFVDLRKQIRGENGVVAATADGIGVQTYVFSVFSLGRVPRALQLAFNRGNAEQDLQIVHFEKLKHGMLRVKDFQNDLAADDRLEAYRQVWPPRRASQFGKYFEPQDPGIRPVYDRRRIFGAVFARAQDDESEKMSWEEMPLIITKDTFKEIALQFNFDKLSNPDGNSKVGEFKRMVNTAIRNQCVLTYSVVVHRTGEPLKPGGIYHSGELRATPVTPFMTSKVLRDRGIMNIYSAFTMVTPLDERIYRQRLDNWQARLQREIDLAVMSHEVEVRNISSRARIQAQEEISATLNAILGDRDYSEEAMALLLFQALEEYISNPETRSRLPNEVFTLLRNVQDRILPSGAGGFPFLRD
ncbi:MAG: hypothetical protein RBT34_00430 [Anaerolineaceae bacterium]|jgi:hypothetical protein|nr:hypothetical protein [Anaerolineaceae bacterium]